MKQILIPCVTEAGSTCLSLSLYRPIIELAMLLTMCVAQQTAKNQGMSKPLHFYHMIIFCNTLYSLKTGLTGKNKAGKSDKVGK